MLRDSHSYESQIIDAVRSVNRALGGTYGKSSAIGKTEFNQYEVQLIDAIRGIGRTLSGNGLSLAGGGDLSGLVTQKEFQSLSARVTKLENESFFRLVDGNVTLKTEYNNLWVPGWLAAGGVGTGGGGGGSSYLKELLDIYHDASGVLRANGDPVSNGDVLAYDSTTDPLNPRWVAAASSGGVTVTNYGDSTTGRIATVNGVDIYNGVKWGSAGTNPNTFTLSINGTTKTVCLDGYGGGTDLASVWNSLTNAVTDEYANTKISLSHIPNITTGMVTDLETWIAGKGYLTSYTETDPTVPAWAKNATPEFYIGTTQVQTSPDPQALTGILSINALSTTPSSSLIVWEPNAGGTGIGAWHFHGNLYSDGWIAAGGIGSSTPPVSNLRELSDVYHSSSSVLRSDGTAVQAGDALVYNTLLGWVAAPMSSASGTVTGVVMNGNTYSPAATGLVDIGTVITSLSGYATEAWVQQQGYLTSFTETDPTVPAWAKAANPLLYIGTTQVQTTAQNQALEGILSVKLTSSASLFEWESGTGAWRFHGNLYADGWVAAGGIGSGGSGGATVLDELDDVTINLSTIANGQALVYRNGIWGNEAVSYNLPIASSSTLGGVKVGSGLYIDNDGTLHSYSTFEGGEITQDLWLHTGGEDYGSKLIFGDHLYRDYVYLQEDTDDHLTIHADKGITISVGSGYSVSIPSLDVELAFSDLTSHPTTLSGYGITDAKIQNGTITLGSDTITPLTSFTETDPTVPSWAKASTKPSYAFSELTSHPTSLSGYGITDAKIQNGTITLGSDTITPLTSFTETDPTVPSWAKASSKPSYSLSEISGTSDLQAIEGLTGTGLLKRTGTNTWALDSTNYLSSHQTIYKLTLNAGSFTAGSFTANSAAKTFNIPTTLDHISDGTNRKLSDYVTLSTTQTITGAKTFTTNAVTIGSSSSLSIDQSSYIDLGPIRIKFENDAVYITKKSSSDTKKYGLYADGFIAAGGLNS